MVCFCFKYTTITFFGCLFHSILLQNQNPILKTLQPPYKYGFGLFPFRSSLTQGISYDFFSSGYLDISVPLVSPPNQKIRVIMISHNKVTLFGHRRITAFCQLLGDYRGLGVLLRLDKSRHPLFALIHIISEICFYYFYFL
jgi:hypothetical protein